MRANQPDFADYWEQTFMEGLKKERLAQGVTQAGLAEGMRELGYRYDQATVYKIENGKRNVTAAEAWGLAEVLNVSIEHLYEWEFRHNAPEAIKMLLRTQADRIFQNLLSLDEQALDLREVHRRFVEEVDRAQQLGLTMPSLPSGSEEEIGSFYAALAGLTLHIELLERLREQVWSDDDTAPLTQLAAHVSGIARLVPLSETSAGVAPFGAESETERELRKSAEENIVKLQELSAIARDAQRSSQRG